MIEYVEIQGPNGYLISCKEWICDNPKEVVIACHGFAGDKESSAISMLAKELLKENKTVITFDLPGHGESKVNGDRLTIDNCLSDFKCIIEYAKGKYPNALFNIFATSYGGYLTLLLDKMDISIKSVILRCPAIKMDKIFIREILEEAKEEFKKKGYAIVGYERKIKVNYSFYESLEKFQLIDIYQNIFSKMMIIVGSEDTTAPIYDTKMFADKFEVPLKIIKGADHRFKNPGELKQVIKYTVDFLNEKI